MELYQNIRKEKKHLGRLKAMRAKIYKQVAPITVAVHKSKEPIAPGVQESLSYSPIEKGAVWADVSGCAWFRLSGRVPETCAGKHVVIRISIGGEGLVYEGTEPISGIAVGSNWHYMDQLGASVAKSVIEVADAAEAGQEIEIYLDAGYNGFCGQNPDFGIFRFAELCVVDDGLRGFYYDYLCIASLLSVTEAADKRDELEGLLDASYALLGQAVDEARAVLAPLFDGEPDPSLNVTAIGHSHLDLAWLWPLRETKRKAQRTFANQLRNFERYPHFTYGASQPWQFEYIKDNAPTQYAGLKAMAAEGRFECQGGMWVEADTNLASGEALIRQILYGKSFFREEFGAEMQICWLPDVFGYNANMPQILKKSGLPYFCTIKLSWNEHNRFPHRSFVWQGIDGSEVLAHMPPDETYNSAGTPACMRFTAGNYPEREVAPEALFLYGVGDGGGGPGEVHIEMIERQARLAGSPSVSHGTAAGFFAKLEKYREALPRYAGELYLETHQGTYTTQGANKNFNRRSEYALQDFEALHALAVRRGYAYPKDKLDAWWKEILLYQFHDIIPGSSIERVYAESQARYAKILKEIEAGIKDVLAFMGEAGAAGRVANENGGGRVEGGKGFSVYNPTGFTRTEYVSRGRKWYLAEVAAHGFAPLRVASLPQAPFAYTAESMANEFVSLRFSKTGEIISLIRKADGFEYAGGELNALRIYGDKRRPLDAWDIHMGYWAEPFTQLKATKVETTVDGPMLRRRSFYKYGRSSIVQDIILYANSPVVYFRTECEWQAKLKMLRADFDVSIAAAEVLCDIQMGSVRRPTGDESPTEKAQFEICAHKYVDLSEAGHGISLLNDCKYGHRVKGRRMSLNLLRSPVWPDPTADRGAHCFTYALFAHEGDCGTETLAHAYALNKPLRVFKGAADVGSLAWTDNPAVVVETLKQSEDGEGVILRLFESQGKAAVCKLETVFGGKAVECDLMEKEIGAVDLGRLEFGGYEMRTVRLG